MAPMTPPDNQEASPSPMQSPTVDSTATTTDDGEANADAEIDADRKSSGTVSPVPIVEPKATPSSKADADIDMYISQLRVECEFDDVLENEKVYLEKYKAVKADVEEAMQCYVACFDRFEPLFAGSEGCAREGDFLGQLCKERSNLGEGCVRALTKMLNAYNDLRCQMIARRMASGQALWACQVGNGLRVVDPALVLPDGDMLRFLASKTASKKEATLRSTGVF
ncbi:hypothetical protein BKA81DRAFT_411260 [Phyllosticta paracitricarpa]